MNFQARLNYPMGESQLRRIWLMTGLQRALKVNLHDRAGYKIIPKNIKRPDLGHQGACKILTITTANYERSHSCMYPIQTVKTTPFYSCLLMVGKRFTARDRQDHMARCKRLALNTGLQVGGTMAKRKKHFKSNLRSDERFTQISRGYMKGAAWLDLSDCARILLVYMRTLYNKHNNGQINMSARYAGEVLNRAPTTAYRALVDLTKKGFIVPHKKGSIGLNGRGVATSWELTDFGMNGKPPTRLYQGYKSKSKAASCKSKPVPGKNKIPYANRIHSNSDLNTLRAKSVCDLHTGDSNLNTGKGVKRPKSVCELNTYIDHIPDPSISFPNNNLEKSAKQVGESQADLAQKIGSGGWEVVMGLPPITMESLTKKNDADLLTDQDIANARLEAAQTSKGPKQQGNQNCREL